MKNSLVSPGKSLSKLDYYQITLSILMTILGVIITLRSVFLGFHMPALIIGFCFLGLGTYRLSFVYRYLKKGQKK